MTQFPEQPPAGPTQPEPAANPFSRLAGAIFSPVETFRSIARRPDWIVPLIVLVVISVATSFVVAPRIDLETSMRAQFEEQEMSEAQIEQAISIAKTMNRFSPLISIVFIPVQMLVIAGVFLLLFKMLGADPSFRQVFSVTLYAWVPQVIKWIAFSAVITTRESVSPEELPALLKSNLAFLADPERPMMLALLGSLDVFTFWTIALLTIGYSEASKFPRGRTAAIVIALWVVVVLVKISFAALQGIGG